MTGEGQGVGWRLQVLEGPRLVGPGVRLEGMEHRTAALLAYLALEGETPRARLAGLLYPDAPTARARNNLVHLLRRLRRAAGAALVEGDQALRLVGGLEIDAQAALRGEGPLARGPGRTALVPGAVRPARPGGMGSWPGASACWKRGERLRCARWRRPRRVATTRRR